MKIVSFLSIIIALMSCSGTSTDADKTRLAKVVSKVLFLSDIEGVVPEDATAEDSTLIVGNYIQSWIKENLILEKAELNLKENQKNFNKQLEDYRKSLIIYSYEKQLIEQKLDTTVTTLEIEQFYEANKANFDLKDDIVKVKYLKVLKTAPKLNRIRKLYKSEKENDAEELKSLAHQYSEKFHLNDKQWILFDELRQEVPLQAKSGKGYLKNIKNVEVEDSLSYYFVYIKAYKLEKDVAPMSFEANNIKNIIINRRKLKLINQLKSELYQEAFLNKDIEIYEVNNDKI